MKTITCKSCGSTVKVVAEELKCSVCDTDLWGYTKDTLPKDFQSLMSFVNYKNKTDRGATGWLIMYADGKESVVYSLHQGENVIGRANPEKAPDIALENDEYVSRNHAIINISTDPFGQFVYIVNDNLSMNGTYINGNSEPLRGESPYELRDGDTIQIGVAKLVLKTVTEVSNQDDALSLVEKMEQHETIKPKNFRKTSIMTRIIK